MKLRHLTNSEFDEASRLARCEGTPLDVCPTCNSQPLTTHDLDTWGRESGTYYLWGKKYDCDCDTQMALRKHYLLANIPSQYQRLNWFDDYSGPDDIREAVAVYLKGWQGFRGNGLGLEFNGPQGTGKTFASTHVGKELIKLGRAVFFIPFLEVISTYEQDDGEKIEKRLRESEYLILDEVRPYISARQGSLYAEKFEILIRHRTNWNLPTIMTTNLSGDELCEHYPRVYSLLAAKQRRIKITGKDARPRQVAEENIELGEAGEIRPLT